MNCLMSFRSSILSLSLSVFLSLSLFYLKQNLNIKSSDHSKMRKIMNETHKEQSQPSQMQKVTNERHKNMNKKISLREKKIIQAAEPVTDPGYGEQVRWPEEPQSKEHAEGKRGISRSEHL